MYESVKSCIFCFLLLVLVVWLVVTGKNDGVCVYEQRAFLLVQYVCMYVSSFCSVLSREGMRSFFLAEIEIHAGNRMILRQISVRRLPPPFWG